MLQQAFDRKIPKCRLDVTVVIDDTAATLMSVMCDNQSCRIAVKLDNGFHACYLKEKDKESSHSDVESKVLVIADLGALGENGCLDMLKTDYDKVIDEYSNHPKKQILEKMVSIAYTGEQVRLVLVELARKGLLFKSVPNKSVLNKKDCFTADYISLIESDNCSHYVNTDFVLRQLQLENCTAEDCKIVYDICNTILKRAAHLAAAGK
ncbi:hexokinase type 2-like [Littorina saxatilis]|uniref:hexokinase type 2-like n=1 Tax=Littorina saxatilis TaxID=31220 RepID=UPI0038B5F4DB